QGSTKTVWHYDELLNEPTGSSIDKNNFFRNPKKSSSAFKQQRNIVNIVEVENISEVKEQVFDGQVEEIFDTYALVVFEINSDFIERKISLERLSLIDSDFEGANIKLLISEKRDGSILSKIEKGYEKPYDFNPDENLIHTLDKLKKLSSK
ncbi:MAG: hypothetical protein Q8M94_21990, partial [Ignavibacteria bacterium]|nr:hypothetical protein [Ignavibacteria bacterium]